MRQEMKENMTAVLKRNHVNAEDIEEILKKSDSERSRELKRIRIHFINELHERQKQLDELDYLIYQCEKEAE